MIKIIVFVEKKCILKKLKNGFSAKDKIVKDNLGIIINVWDLLKKIKYKNRVLFVMLAKNMNNNNK
jgi:hypothetical protein